MTLACACHKAPAVLLDISIGPTCSQQQDSRQTSKQTDRYTQTHGPSAVSQQQQRALLPSRKTRETFTHTCWHMLTPTYTNCKRPHSHSGQHESKHPARSNTRTHAPTHALTHSHTHSHTHTRTRSLSLSLSLSLSHDLYKHMRTHKQTRKHRGVCLALSLLLVLLSQQEQYSEKKRMKNLLQSAPECNSSQHQDTAPGHSFMG